MFLEILPLSFENELLRETEDFVLNHFGDRQPESA